MVLTKIMFVGGLCVATTGVMAQLSNAESIAALGGRILGAAKACGVSGSDTAAVGEKILKTASARAGSEKERGAVLLLFTDTYNVGAAQVSSGAVKCSDARSAFRDLQRRVQ